VRKRTIGLHVTHLIALQRSLIGHLRQRIKGAHVGAGAALGKIDLGLQHGQFFGQGNADKLVDADAILIAETLDTGSDGTWQAQWVGG